MKVNIKRAIYHIAVYMSAAVLIFTLVFAVIYYVAYNEMYFPHQKIRLNGAKNLVQEMPVLESAPEETPDIENYHGEEIQGEFVKKP